jgi:Ca-activated chloride channel homolog
MFRFEHLNILYFLLIIPVFIGMFWWSRRIWARRLKHFGEIGLVRRLLIGYSSEKPVWKFVLLMLSLVLFIFALANPQSGSRLKEVKREGVEIIIALDVSKSMNARDIIPDRLTKAKRSIELFINKLEGDMLGMVVFAGESFIQIPMTVDYASAKMYLKSINTDLVSVQGTNMADAIKMASNAFSQDEASSKVIVLISDGENHEPDAVEQAKIAKESGIVIYTVGMGTREGAPIPASGGSFHKDKNGNTIISKLDEKVLKDIASAGEGKYILAGKSGAGLDAILNDIVTMNKTERKVEVFSEFDDQYQYPLALGILLLLIEFFIPRRKRISESKNLYIL